MAENTKDPDIFLSYAEEDTRPARLLAKALIEKGWSVRWEHSLRAGSGIDQFTEEALIQIRCVIVLWSYSSVTSPQVRAEAQWALNKEKLVPVVLDEGLVLPPPFDAVTQHSLFGSSGEIMEDAFQGFVGFLSMYIWVRADAPISGSLSFPSLPEMVALDLPGALREQLRARALIQKTVPPPFIAASAPQYSPPPAKSSSPIGGRRDQWASHQAPFPLLGVVIRYAALAGAIALAAWAGFKFLPLIFGTTTSTKNRNPDQSPVETSPVDCTVFAPPKLALGDEILVQVFLHPPEMGEEAEAGAKQFDSDAEKRGVTPLSLDLASGARVAVQLVAGDLEISDDGCGEIRWSNRVVGVSFLAKAPKDVQLGKRYGSVHLLVDGVPAGRIHFVIDVKASLEERAEPEGLGDDVHRYRNAFISYASDDRAEVLKRVQALKVLKIHYFQDVLDLDPGERWEKRLYKEIDKCDLFLLFWSTASKNSEWVHKEAAYARDRQIRLKTEEPSIIPMMIEGPPPPDPWPELSHLHFNDKLLYLMRCEEKS